MLLRFDPFREFDRLADDLERRSEQPRPLAMDAVKRGNHVVVSLDVPGVAADDIDISVERNQLSVTATRHADWGEDDQAIVGERRHGEFRRNLTLGDTLDTDGVEADVTDGVLTLRIPVAETAKPRKISVASGGSETKAIDA